MADNGAQERTEKPTARRLSEARKKGQVAHSRELSQLLGMIAAYTTLRYVAPYLWNEIKVLAIHAFSGEINEDFFTVVALQHSFLSVMQLILPPILVLMVIASIFGAGSTLVQTDFLWCKDSLKPKWLNIAPLAGIKRIFSPHNYMRLGLSIAKLAMIGPIAYSAFKEFFPELVGLMKLPLSSFFPFTIYVMDYIFWEIVKWVFILVIIDYFWQKYKMAEQLKMSKQEIKEERKAAEGDEATKRKIQAIGLQRARQRMFDAVKTADVVVTNPTHFAVALSYSMEPGSAPKVVAKGKNYMALKIRELAKQSGVPVVERKPLARALFKSVEVGKEIPYELYHAVAELLAYVYRIKGKRLNRKK